MNEQEENLTKQFTKIEAKHHVHIIKQLCHYLLDVNKREGTEHLIDFIQYLATLQLTEEDSEELTNSLLHMNEDLK